MRAPTAVAILSLIVGGTVCRAPAPCYQVRLSILLHLRCSSFILLCRIERAGGRPLGRLGLPAAL
jgi:hypothetical protein